MGISADLSGFIVQQQHFMAGPDGMNIARIFPFVTFNFGQRFRCSMVAQQHPLRIVTPGFWSRFGPVDGITAPHGKYPVAIDFVVL